jgi:Flp pilus assembly protein TadG
MRHWKSERGTELVEAAIAVPIVLLLAVGLMEFGRAYQTWQVLSSSAREAARLATVPNTDPGAPETRAYEVITDGGLTNPMSATVVVDRASTMVVNGSNVSATMVTVDYPFEFQALGTVAGFINPEGTLGSSVTLHASALMRNDSP